MQNSKCQIIYPFGTDCSGQNSFDMSGKRGKKRDSKLEVNTARIKCPKVTSSRQQAEKRDKTTTSTSAPKQFLGPHQEPEQTTVSPTIVSQFIVGNLLICVHWEK